MKGPEYERIVAYHGILNASQRHNISPPVLPYISWLNRTPYHLTPHNIPPLKARPSPPRQESLAPGNQLPPVSRHNSQYIPRLIDLLIPQAKGDTFANTQFNI